MSVRHSIVLRQPGGAAKSGQSVELYTALETSPFYTNPKIGDFTDNGDGAYYIDITTGLKGTVLVNGAIYPPRVNHKFSGDDADIPDDSITSAKIAAGAVGESELAAGAGGGGGTGFDHQILDNSHSIELDQFIHDINPLGYTNIPEVVLVPKSGWGCYVDSVDEDSIVVKPNPSGQGSTWDYDLFIISNG